MDTDPQTRKLAAFMLGKQGYTVLEARNRVEAFALFDRRAADVELLLLEAKGRGWELAESRDAGEGGRFVDRDGVCGAGAYAKLKSG